MSFFKYIYYQIDNLIVTKAVDLEISSKRDYKSYNFIPWFSSTFCIIDGKFTPSDRININMNYSKAENIDNISSITDSPNKIITQPSIYRYKKIVKKNMKSISFTNEFQLMNNEVAKIENSIKKLNDLYSMINKINFYRYSDIIKLKTRKNQSLYENNN